MMKTGYLRVMTPRTVDGNVPSLGEDGRVEYVESHLNLKAKKIMEAKNEKLPKHLKHIIEEVFNEVPPDQKKAEFEANKGKKKGAKTDEIE